MLYVDLDVHHGDGVQAIHWDDPGVLTVSFHETGRYAVPGDAAGSDELGEGTAAGTVGQRAAGARHRRAGVARRRVRTLLPELAAAFGPDLIVVAARRRFARLGSARAPARDHDRDGRGGPAGRRGGPPVRRRPLARDRRRRLRRVPGRAADRGASSGWRAPIARCPPTTPADWRERWATEGARYGQAPLPRTFDDAPNAGLEFDAAQRTAEAASSEVAATVRAALVPRLLREARDRGWWDPLSPADGRGHVDVGVVGIPEIIATVDGGQWSDLALSPRVIAPADASHGHAIVAAALADGAHVTGAVAGSTVVGLAVSVGGTATCSRSAWHPTIGGSGLAGRLLAANSERPAPR